ncbi:GNAT family N-acetyltransferase [Streptosporangium sp. NPDC000239]|uniref:GNAT family N-acetyltransferase n=1 Tax=Streptosporangium sp. NPDC000239 TaxID=3154248 RepID=UPI003332EDD8
MKQLPALSVAEVFSERLLLRRALRDGDREGLVELSTDPEVQAYIGGPRPLGEVERHFDEVMAAGATTRPGNYVIADNTTNQVIGTLMLARWWTDHPRRVTEDGEELVLGYVLRRGAWGAGYAFEAATAALRAAAEEFPDQPVVLVTQTANKRSLKLAERLGFHLTTTFEEFDAEQALCVTRLSTFRA